MASVRASNAVTAVQLHELPPNSVKFSYILHHFCTTWAKGRCPNVDHIFEIDNARLKFRWDCFKQSMGSPVTVEQCYYGNTLQCDLASTKRLCNNERCDICQISQGGFGATTRSGCRFFLAPNSSKSHEYTNRSYNYRTMFLCDVLPGNKYTVSASPTRVPPPPAGFDSVYLTPGGDLNDPLIILYEEACILPRYIIMYAKGPKIHPSQGAHSTEQVAVPLIMEQLLRFTSKTRTFNVTTEVGTAYSKMGVFLLKDQTGAVVQALEKEHMRDAERISMAIFSQWLQGKGAQPVAWTTLIDVLRKIDLCALADDIEGGLM